MVALCLTLQTKKEEVLFVVLLVSYFAGDGHGSHLLDTRRSTGSYINIQDQVIESCRGHFMCEVFPYQNTYGLTCLNINLVCDGVSHCRDGADEIPSMCQGFRLQGNHDSASVSSLGTFSNRANAGHVSVDNSQTNDQTLYAYADAQHVNGETVTSPQSYGTVHTQHSEYHETPNTRSYLSPITHAEAQVEQKLHPRQEEQHQYHQLQQEQQQQQKPQQQEQQYQHLQQQQAQQLQKQQYQQLQQQKLTQQQQHYQQLHQQQQQEPQQQEQQYQHLQQQQPQQLQKQHQQMQQQLTQQQQNYQQFQQQQQPLKQQQYNTAFSQNAQTYFGLSGNTSANTLSLGHQDKPGLNLNVTPKIAPDTSNENQLFTDFARYFGMRNNNFGNGLGMWFQEIQLHQNPFLSAFYGFNRPGESGALPELTGALQYPVTPEAAFTNIVETRQQTDTPGSSYLDKPVEPPPHTEPPDGIIPAPGQEPHLLQEQNFLEQQFYLTNLLDASQQFNHKAVGFEQEQYTGATNEGFANEMLIGQMRQEQLLRDQFAGWNTNPERNDLNKSQRYGLSGPFDGGVPTGQGEIGGLTKMDGTEAQSAIHTLEALQ